MKLTTIFITLFFSVCAMAQEKIVVTQNVAYDEHKSCVMDIAQPVSQSKELRPAIVIVHGGGWAAGDKRDAVYTNLLVDYAMKGYVTFSVNYRLISSFPSPRSNNAAELQTCIEDVEHAVAWIKAHAQEYGVDPTRIGSFGHSAGGHLSLMLGVKGLVTCAVGGAPPTEIGNPTYKEWTIKSNGKGLCKELRIKQKNGKSIYGIYSHPTRDRQGEKPGIAIISHGFNGTHHFGKDYFKTLNDLGYAVYTFDFPCGSIHSQSDNNTMEMSVTDEKNALKEIVAYFQKQKDIDGNKIVLIGESQGGLVSALAASELKQQVSNLVLIYPAFCIPDDWNARYPRVEDIPEVTELWEVKLGKKFMMDIRQMKPYETIGNYKGNVLIVHGSDDKVVALDYSKRAEQTYDHATLKVINKAGHGFNPRERTLSNQYVREFLVQ